VVMVCSDSVFQNMTSTRNSPMYKQIFVNFQQATNTDMPPTVVYASGKLSVAASVGHKS